MLLESRREVPSMRSLLALFCLLALVGPDTDRPQEEA
jgi:hypothetical protein